MQHQVVGDALHRIALVRMFSDKRTREYVARQSASGRSKMEILRLLKRALAREAFRLLTTVCEVGGWPTVISRLERGLQRDDTLIAEYRNWLAAA